MWNKIFQELIDYAGELADLHDSPDAKLETLTKKAIQLFEDADDALVSLLPPGFAQLAQLIVDNPIVDGPEAAIAKSVAEAAYQAWKAVRDFAGVKD